MASGAAVTGCYVEQEPPYKRPPLESARISHAYLKGLTVYPDLRSWGLVFVILVLAG